MADAVALVAIYADIKVTETKMNHDILERVIRARAGFRVSVRVGVGVGVGSGVEGIKLWLAILNTQQWQAERVEKP